MTTTCEPAGLSFATYDIRDLVYGESWSLPMTYRIEGVPVDLTGKRLYGQFRAGLSRISDLLIELDSDADTVNVTDAAGGKFTLQFSALQAEVFVTAKGGWDLWLLEGPSRDLLIKGTWESRESITDWETFPP